MCVDFTDLNKLCPNELYPLLCIDRIVNATLAISFMDTYSSYYQIKMVEKDALHMAFYVDKVIYHYTIMPFGLIIIGAT